jgi:hypothetical protein
MTLTDEGDYTDDGGKDDIFGDHGGDSSVRG